MKRGFHFVVLTQAHDLLFRFYMFDICYGVVEDRNFLTRTRTHSWKAGTVGTEPDAELSYPPYPTCYV